MVKSIIDGLNESQKEAVLTTEGPVMVMAGAGSGKTRVLTRRIAHLILDLDVYPSNILALTFTNKAAREMKERVASLVNTQTKYMWVSTFHSFCARFLRLEISHLSEYTNEFQIIDDDESDKIIKQIIKDLGHDPKDVKSREFAKYISEEKNLGYTSIDSKDFSKMNLYLKIKDIYQKKLLEQNLLDFDDLISVSLRILKEFLDVRLRYQEKFKYILVDEFQDTNNTQYELIKLLANQDLNVFVVGDEDQSIYSFRGARVENVGKFREDFKNTKVILLEENYRSTNNILHIANNVISNNKSRIVKNLFTSNKENIKPKYYIADSNYDEERYIVNKIKELRTQGYGYKDFAIMYRSNYLSRSLEETLNKFSLPYELYGGISFFQRKEIKDICAYLRLIINHNDDFSFERIVNEPKRKIGPAMIEKLKEIKNMHNVSLFDSINYISSSGNGYNNLVDFKFCILELEEYLFDPINKSIDIINQILDKTGYGKMLKESGEDGEDRLDNVLELKSHIKQYEIDYPELNRKDMFEFMLQNMTLMTDMDNKDPLTDRIKLMTYHQAKGLEFPVVFMIALEEEIFPNKNVSENPSELEEERRICYVGITRAKERLFLTASVSRFLFGHKEAHLISRFVREMGIENLERDGIVKTTIPTQVEKKQEVKEEKHTNDLAVGDVIKHNTYGEGRVVEIKGNIATIAFSVPTGIKKMLKDHPSITKVN